MKSYEVMSANEAVASVCYNFIDIACVYPITPSTEMAETIDRMSFKNERNFFEQKVIVREMQSELGSIAMMHGALTSGATAATFTCSQGLLLMIPEMYRISAASLPGVIHVASRAVARHALSIFGDHSDVYACRQTGWTMLCSSSVQEAQDFSAISHLSAIYASFPVLHFFDGFRTSHEIRKIRLIDKSYLEQLLDKKKLKNFRNASLNPSRDFIRGSNQNDDIFFQCCEAKNVLEQKTFDSICKYMEHFNNEMSTSYHPFDFYGDFKAEFIIVAMGSVCSSIEEAVDYLNDNLKTKKVGLIKVRLFRPFNSLAFGSVIPKSAIKISVLDKSKELGATGEPLFLDVLSSVVSLGLDIQVLHGRYGIGGKNTSVRDIFGVFENMFERNPKKIFTIGIKDDVTMLSLNGNKNLIIASKTIDCKFFGIGSDGMVGASKNIARIIGKKTKFNIQYYPQYDSKKSGGLTISHLRFGESDIKSEYYIEKADYLICSNPEYLYEYDFSKSLKKNSKFLINSKHNIKIPRKLYDYIKNNNISVYTVDAKEIAEKLDLKSFYGVIMQGAFFKICSQLEFGQKKDLVTSLVKDFYYRKAPQLINANVDAIELAFESVRLVNIFGENVIENPEYKFDMNNFSVSDVLDFSNGNTPSGTSQKNKIVGNKIPNWFPENCIQCGLCSMICPHGCIGTYIFEGQCDEKIKFSNLFGNNKLKFSVYVDSEHCTGCMLCSKICPGMKNIKALEMSKKENYKTDFFENIEITPEMECKFPPHTIKGSQLKRPLMKFSSACPGCGETSYAKLVTQLFGERLIISNATGCSSIWGGSFCDIPYLKSKNGFLPAWQNSLFENAAEFGIGMYDAHKSIRLQILKDIQKLLTQKISEELKNVCIKYIETFDIGDKNFEISSKLEKNLQNNAGYNNTIDGILEKKEYLSKKSFWIFGGDGWAYDIGFGGLDHIMASGENINILVFDTEIYSNTGGQASKATPKNAAATFALGGKTNSKKPLAKMMQFYENVYIAQVAIGANPAQCVKAFCEAENHNGPSLIVAYSPCVGHKIKGGMSNSLEAQKLAVDCGYFDLFRYNPKNKKMMQDSDGNINLKSEFFKREMRFENLEH